MKFSHYILKRGIENIFITPFILVGRLIGWLNPLRKTYDNFLFFPFYHTGGAEKVHAQIAQAVGGSNTIIYFTRISNDQRFLPDFKRSGSAIKNIANYTDNKYLYFLNLIYRGIITTYINQQKRKPVVFNGQCNFAYKIAPWINKEVAQIELIHSYNTFSSIRLPFIPFICKTIMISEVRIQDHVQQYERLNVPAHYKQRIQFIVNGISMPASQAAKDYSATLQVLYVGRGTSEKRVHLVAQLARNATTLQLPVRFVFMGDVDQAIPGPLLPYCTLLGNMDEANEIEAVYQQAHIVIITSNTEGFPMVIEEGMANGCAIIATPVGDIPLHVKHNTNGYLFSSVEDEKVIVQEGLNFLTHVVSNRTTLAQMGAANINYAQSHFSMESFNRKYLQLFKQHQNPQA